MKIGFSFKTNSNCLDKAKSGKEKFLLQLSVAMELLGAKIDNNKPDIYLRLTGQKRNDSSKLNILRLNGLWINKIQPYKKRNKKIVDSISCSDAIIYQGKFCKDSHRKFLKIRNKPNCIIHNGADPDKFKKRNVENFFLANCKWRPHKRLKDIVQSFIIACDMGLDSKLIVTGDPDFKIKHNKIEYIGWQNHNILSKLLSHAIASIHLSYLDWCPNSMIESIVAGCPLIYSNSGGHKEIALEMGIPINDKGWDFKKAIYLYNPPKIDRVEVAKAMLKMKSNRYTMGDKNKFYISNIAKKYIDFFERCL